MDIVVDGMCAFMDEYVPYLREGVIEEGLREDDDLIRRREAADFIVAVHMSEEERTVQGACDSVVPERPFGSLLLDAFQLCSYSFFLLSDYLDVSVHNRESIERGKGERQYGNATVTKDSEDRAEDHDGSVQ